LQKCGSLVGTYCGNHYGTLLLGRNRVCLELFSPLICISTVKSKYWNYHAT